MAEYDFSTLSPHDFEILSRDLLQEELGLHLETFKTGRDLGIDLRYAKPQGKSTLIIQCKHYRRSGFSKLRDVLKRDELPKINDLKPARYVLTTSVSLSPDQKDVLVNVLHPHCRGPGDVFGCEDLNNLLQKHQEIERQHFKLWLPSTGVLHRLLHNGIFTQSALEAEEIKRQLSLFVPTGAVERGLTMLKESGFCMLTGIPGIGKTTTARILVAHHIYEDWEGVYISNRAGEAFNVFRADEKQIFFYDDFLGQTSLEEKLPKNEDKELKQLVQACRKNPMTKRFVLTTREFLLEQAKRQHEIFKRSKIDLGECTVKLSDYTDNIRAEILVNHLYFYGIDPEVCSTFVTSGLARKTLNHPNYNPRIVETMCEMQQDIHLGPSAFGKKFIELLDTPEEIWKHAYDNQLSQNARELFLVFAICGNRSTIASIKTLFGKLIEHVHRNMIGFEAAFQRSLEELEGNFLVIHPHPKFGYVTYHNPSIKDFADRQLNNESGFLRVVIKSFTYEAVLARAAQRLVAAKAKLITGEEILGALQSGNYAESFCVRDSSLEVLLEPPDSRVVSLSLWINIVESLRDRPTSVKMLRYVEQFIREANTNTDSVFSFVELYRRYERLATRARVKPKVLVREFAQRFVEKCYAPDDFMNLYALVQDCEGLEDIATILLQMFPEDSYDWLHSEIFGATSSEQINEAITSVTETAEFLGVPDSMLDLHDAYQRAAELARHEDAEADMREDDRQMQRYEERLESQAIDDILDSLRE